MEEDNIQYYNDEWNYLKPSDFFEKYYKVLDQKGNLQNIVLRDIDKEFINNHYKKDIIITDLNTNKEYNDINKFLEADFRNNLIFGTDTLYKINK